MQNTNRHGEHPKPSNGKKKPFVSRWAKQTNTMAIAKTQASKLSDTDISNLMGSLSGAYEDFRRGSGTLNGYKSFMHATIVADVIEAQRVIRGLSPEIAAVHESLRTIQSRCLREDKTWKSSALYATELKALKDFLFAHKLQLCTLSLGEYERAFRAALRILAPSQANKSFSSMKIAA